MAADAADVFRAAWGPLTLAYALANRLESRRANRVHYPEEKIMIG